MVVGSGEVDALALLVLKPDAVHQRLEPAIRSFLRGRGFEVEWSMRLRISAETRHDLYRPDLHPWSTDWGLGNVLFALGDAVVLLLRNERVPSEHQSASRFLSGHLKGNHDPLRAGAGTIRGEFNSVNRALNLVHAADDSGSLLREVRALVGSPDALEAADPDDHPGTGPRSLDFAAAILRVHEWLLVDRAGGAGPRAAAAGVVDAARTRLEAASGRHERHSIVVATLAALERLARERRDEAGALALALADRSGFARVDYGSVFDRLEAAGLGLDPWTRYLLHTSLYYLDPATAQA
jgi:nucleoside diphosphate kinase